MSSNCTNVFYDTRVHLGNWLEESTLQEDAVQSFLEKMKGGELLLAKFRAMEENLLKPTFLTQSPKSIWYGSKISLTAPLVPVEDPGLVMGGFISQVQIEQRQRLGAESALAACADAAPRARSTFLVCPAGGAARDGDALCYNHDFALVLEESAKEQPLYVRYDPDPIPGLSSLFPLYLSASASNNTRWRALPLQAAGRTRFEMEGSPVPVNENLVINHCATNTNLAAEPTRWSEGFFGKNYSLLVKNYLNVHKCETAENIWQIYSPIQKQM